MELLLLLVFLKKLFLLPASFLPYLEHGIPVKDVGLVWSDFDAFGRVRPLLDFFQLPKQPRARRHPNPFSLSEETRFFFFLQKENLEKCLLSRYFQNAL